MGEAALSNPGEWVDRHGDALFAYALLQTGSATTAEERVQETLLAALEARSSFRGESSERTWLMAILKNKIRDMFRKRRVRAIPSESATGEIDFDPDGTWRLSCQAWRGGPESAASDAEFWAVLRLCLEGLGPQMHGAFCLREFQELDSPEICKVLGVSATNLWTLLHRARARLRECLERQWFGEEREDRH